MAKSRTLGLGGFALVSLAEEREQALANRKLAREGGDPLAARRRRGGMPTFEEAASEVWRQKRDAWRNAKHAKDWPASLRLYVFSHIGDKHVSEVTSADLLQVLTPLWRAKPETARRVRQRVGAVMKWAVAMELRPDNPAGEALGQALGRQQDVVLLAAGDRARGRDPRRRRAASRRRGSTPTHGPPVPEPARQGALRHDALEAGQGAGHRGRAARTPNICRPPPSAVVQDIQ